MLIKQGHSYCRATALVSFILFIIFSTRIAAQSPDSINSLVRGTVPPKLPIDKGFDQPGRVFQFRSLIIPATLISYGFVALQSEELKEFDNYLKEEIWTEVPHHQIKIDNYLQYAPAAAAFGLNALGVKGQHNLKDMSMVYLMSNAIMGITVQSLKKITRIQRPDGHGTNAFPSGHTATAFVSAEFLRREYGHLSPWYGIGGYATAATTAYLRMYNNKHWFRDLLPGAGIGMLSTGAAYWLCPKIQNALCHMKRSRSLILSGY